MRIKVVCGCDTSENVTKRFIRNYVTYENSTPYFQLTYDDNYDALIVLNKTHEHILSHKDKTFGFIMEPSWSPNWDRNIGAYCNTVFFHDLSLLGKIPSKESFIESPSFMFYHMDQEPIARYIDRMNAFQKTKPMSYVVKNFSPRDHNRLGWKRVELAHQILQSDLPIDIFGYGWDVIHDNRIKGSLENKEDGLRDYMFSIAIENSSENNYLTEKFIDCLLCDSVPVYFGAPNASDIYSGHPFIGLDLFGDAIEQLRNIIANSQALYKKINISSAKREYFKRYNIYDKVIEMLLSKK